MAQLGRAPALGAGGRRFESCRSDHTKCGCNSMVECQPSKLITRVRFPSPAPFFCQKWQTSVPVAQGIEQRTSNPLVGGSIPSWDAKKIKCFRLRSEALFHFDRNFDRSFNFGCGGRLLLHIPGGAFDFIKGRDCSEAERDVFRSVVAPP